MLTCSLAAGYVNCRVYGAKDLKLQANCFAFVIYPPGKYNGPDHRMNLRAGAL